MASVAELIRASARALNLPVETVNVYARALLDAELLPRSSGKRIATVEPVHVIRLLMALALTPKVKDAASTVDIYGTLTPVGLPKETIHKLGLSDRFPEAEVFLASIYAVLDNPQSAGRKDLSEVTVEIIETWPQITVTDGKTKARYVFGDAGIVLRAPITRSAFLGSATMKSLSAALVTETDAARPKK